MRFPNLAQALVKLRVSTARIAGAVGLTEPQFTRRLFGLADFTTREKELAAQFMGTELDWLFVEASILKPALSSRLYWESEDGTHVSDRKAPA